MSRTCGTCSQCCRVMAVEVDQDEGTYFTPQGHWCKFCDKPGCSIYGTLYQKECKSFNCGWLENDNIPDNLKPNVSGIVLETLDNNLNTSKFWIDEKNFSGTSAAITELEKYTTRKYTNIYNGE